MRGEKEWRPAFERFTVDTRHRLWSQESDLSTNDLIKKAHLNGTGSIKERTKNSSTVIPLGPPEDSTLSENRPGDLKSKGKTKGPKAQTSDSPINNLGAFLSKT